ncbi:MAG: hypothetical protein IJU41_03765, partial [Clostridia bacterium]|nr:hypothetical protein [Clostridia bacterium]
RTEEKGIGNVLRGNLLYKEGSPVLSKRLLPAGKQSAELIDEMEQSQNRYQSFVNDYCLRKTTSSGFCGAKPTFPSRGRRKRERSLLLILCLIIYTDPKPLFSVLPLPHPHFAVK